MAVRFGCGPFTEIRPSAPVRPQNSAGGGGSLRRPRNHPRSRRGRRMPVNEGGISGDGLTPVPRVRSAGGGDECRRNGPDLLSRARPGRGLVHSQARLSGMATNRVPCSDFTRISTLCLPSARALPSALPQLVGRGDGLAADLENHVAGLEAEIGGRDRTDRPRPRRHPARLPPGVSDRPSRGSLLLPLPDRPLVSARASRAFGNSPSVRLTVFSAPLRRMPSLTVAPGAMPPILRARSRASATGLSFTRGDDVAGLDAGLDRRAILLRLGDQRARRASSCRGCRRSPASPAGFARRSSRASPSPCP